MKKIIKIFCVLAVVATLCVCFTSPRQSYADSVFDDKLTSAEGAVLMEVSTERVFFQKNAHARLPMASTTKIMTALIALEYAYPDEIVTVDKRAVGIEGSSIYLREGEIFTVEQLLYGLMLRSGNDAAVALAIHVAGSVEKFVALMNAKVKELGLADTRFVNPHGLHDEGHYTSAFDLGVISCKAMKNSLFKKIVGTKRIVVGIGENRRLFVNKNKLLKNLECATGVKTGFTKKAGRCFVGGAEKDGLEMVCVVLNCGPMFENSKAMLEKSFECIEMKKLFPKNKLCAVIWKRDRPVYYYLKDGLSYPFLKGETGELVKTVEYDEKNRCYKLIVSLGKQLIFSQKLYTI